jgi:UDP-glucose 4-epimerase
MKILITGGAGFIGSNLIEFLLDKTDWKINILDDLSTGSLDNLKNIKNFNPKRVIFFKGDIRNKKDVLKAVKGCDYLVNLAAQTGVIPAQKNPLEGLEINILGLLNVLEIARDNKVKKVIQISSGAPLGKQKIPFNEKKLPLPISLYGASKLAGEGYCSAFSSSFDLNVTVLRFASVYGPFSFHKQSAAHRFIKDILKGEEIIIYGKGNQTRDFLYVKDACNSIYLALTKKLSDNFNLFHIGKGKETSINNLFCLIKEELESRGYKVKKPIYKKERKGEIKRNYFDIKKAKKYLRFLPKTDLKSGIKNTADFLLHQKIK